MCCENAVHTSIHTTFAAFAQRPRKLCGRRELAPRMSETGGFIETRPGQRSRRRTARMLYYSTLAQNTLRGLLAVQRPMRSSGRISMNPPVLDISWGTSTRLYSV